MYICAYLFIIIYYTLTYYLFVLIFGLHVSYVRILVSSSYNTEAAVEGIPIIIIDVKEINIFYRSLMKNCLIVRKSFDLSEKQNCSSVLSTNEKILNKSLRVWVTIISETYYDVSAQFRLRSTITKEERT